MLTLSYTNCMKDCGTAGPIKTASAGPVETWPSSRHGFSKFERQRSFPAEDFSREHSILKPRLV